MDQALMFVLIVLLLGSCASHPAATKTKTVDAKADKILGADEELEADETLDDLEQSYRDQQKRNIERQITETTR